MLIWFIVFHAWEAWSLKLSPQYGNTLTDAATSVIDRLPTALSEPVLEAFCAALSLVEITCWMTVDYQS